MYYFHRTVIKRNDRIELLFTAENYYARMIELIQSARESIHLQTYIFKNDSIGGKILEALKAASERGVKVYLLVDQLGSLHLVPHEKDLQSHNFFFRFFGKFRWFSLFDKKYYLGRRLHHKILLIDQEKALVSGINIGEPFLTWFDFAVYLEGGSCEEIFKVCIHYWPLRIRYKLKKNSKKIPFHGNYHAKILNNDNLIHIQRINRRLNYYLHHTQQELLIISPYFFPSHRFLRKLHKLKNKNVSIKIICNAISDIPLIHKATSYYYSSLLKHGIEIYELKTCMLHGKALFIDGRILSIGSYNMNYMSYFTNIELNIEIHSQEIAAQFYNHIQSKLKTDILKVTEQNISNGIFSRINAFFAYLIVRMVSIFSVLVVRGKKKIHLEDI